MKTDDGPRVRLAVLGHGNVGKSALTVRYLTRRFIGEYRSNADLLYRQAVLVNGSFTDVEIIDVSGETRDSNAPPDADGFVVVYSITDRESFAYAKQVLDQLADVRGLPVTLLANKADLEHLRAVDAEEGRALCKASSTPFHEVSVAEDSAAIYNAFELLVGDCRTMLLNNNNNTSTTNNNSVTNGKVRKFSVTKMLGTLIGSGKSSSPPPSSPQPLQGTVVVCPKSVLYRSGVLSQRRERTQRTSGTASL